MATLYTFSIYYDIMILAYVSMQMWSKRYQNWESYLFFIRYWKARKRLSFLGREKKLNKQRVCLLIDFEIYKKLRDIQADKIKKTKRSVTFSQTVEDLVKIGIKNGKAKWIQRIYKIMLLDTSSKAEIAFTSKF